MEWLGLVRFWEEVFMLIEPSFESQTNVNFGIATFGCNSGFIDYVNIFIDRSSFYNCMSPWQLGVCSKLFCYGC